MMAGKVSDYLKEGALVALFANPSQANREDFNNLLRRDGTATKEQYAAIIGQLIDLGKDDYDKPDYIKSARIAFTCYFEKLAPESELDQSLVELTTQLFSLFEATKFADIDEFLAAIFQLTNHPQDKSSLLGAWLVHCLNPFLNTKLITPDSPLIKDRSNYMLVGCFNKSKELLLWLIRNIKNLALLAHQKSSMPGTPVIHLCAAWGIPEVIVRMLGAGADKNVKDADDDWSLPLHYLAWPHRLNSYSKGGCQREASQFLRVVELLLPEAGINAQNSSGRTLFSYLVEHSVSINSEILDSLIKQGAYLLSTDSDGKIPLHYLGQSDHFSYEVVDYLAELYVRNAWRLEDKQGNTPMHCIVQSGNLDLVRVLVDKHEVPLVVNSRGQWPSDLVFGGEDAEALKGLLKSYEQRQEAAASCGSDTQVVLRIGVFKDQLNRRYDRIDADIINIWKKVHEAEAMLNPLVLNV